MRKQHRLGKGGWVRGFATVLIFMAGFRAPAQDTKSKPIASAPTTVIILRHAERLSDDKDTPLSEAGQARARALVPWLKSLKPDVVIVSELQRTRQTVAPFLEATHSTALVRSNGKCADLAAEILKNWRGRTVLMAWHRGPNVDLAKALGAPEPFPQWGHDTYDRYWVITIPEQGAVTLLERVQPFESPGR